MFGALEAYMDPANLRARVGSTGDETKQPHQHS